MVVYFLWWIEINDNYKFSANNNVLRYDVQQPVRGLIYDRNKKLIVANVPAYDLMIIPREVVNNIDSLLLCKLLNITIEEYSSRLKKAKK